MKSYSLAVVLVIPLSAAMDGLARAGPVTWQFAGEVTRVSDPESLLGSGVEVGSLFSGSYTFESTTPDSNPDSSQGIYNNAVLAISGTIGSVNFAGPVATRENVIRIHNAIHDDLYAVRAGTILAGQTLDLGLFLIETSGSTLFTDMLPPSPPNVDLFEFRGIGVSDTFESVPLVIDARLTSLVPEPATLTLLAFAAALVARIPSKRKCRVQPKDMPTGCRQSTIGILIGAAAILGSVRFASATDCNVNGINDTDEISQCKVDLVFVFDTSTSISPETMTYLCAQSSVAIGDLSASGVVVSAEKLRISPDPPPGNDFRACGCCTSSVAQVYGTTALPEIPETLTDCSNEEGKLEDWGVATGIIAANRNWTAGAIRIIIPMSDEPPRCGSPTTDCADLTATYHGIVPLSRNHIIVAPIVDSQDDPFAKKFAEGGQSKGQVFTLSQSGLGTALANFVQLNCGHDCNGNAVLDRCEIDNSAVPDCNSYKTDCCVAHTTPGCANAPVSACVCNPPPGGFGFATCCSSAWDAFCADVATDWCGANCAEVPDGIPDECQPSADCNANVISDICDISCGVIGGSCQQYAACGQKADCNHNCIPDDCEQNQCDPIDGPGFCDCNANGALDVCDIANAVSCDLDGNRVPDECFACCTDSNCQNRISTYCAGQFYAGQPCTDICCQAIACCLGETCTQELSLCECSAQGGHFGGGALCYEDTCGTGSCCVATGDCHDQRSEEDQTLMTKAICDETTFSGIFFGGIRCAGGECVSGQDDHESCRVDADCVGGTCLGTPPELAQPSPCAPVIPPVLPPLREISGVAKNRSISFTPRNSGVSTAFRVTLTSLHHPNPPNIVANPSPEYFAFESGLCCTDPNGCARWVGKPGTFLESQDSGPSSGTYKAARLQCTPFYHDWGGEGVVHVTGAEIVPSSTYDVQVFAASCEGDESNCADVSCPLQFTTARFGDVEVDFCPPTCGDGTGGQPNSIDLSQLVNKWKNVVGAPVKARSQLQPNLPELNADINALDIVAVVDGVKQKAYPYNGPCACPSAVPCGLACDAEACTNVPGSMCVKTCVGGANAGDSCINNTHCPGGGACDKACDAGSPNAGEPCNSLEDCNICSGDSNYECNDNADCEAVEAGTCSTYPCVDINTATCRDRCGRCTP